MKEKGVKEGGGVAELTRRAESEQSRIKKSMRRQ